MPAVEKLEAAIKRLEELRDDAGHDWREYRQDPEYGADPDRWAVGKWENYGGEYGLPEGPDGIIQTNIVACDVLPEVAQLIVTLHRTIDAQLGIMRGALVLLDDGLYYDLTYSDGRPLSAERVFKASPEGRATLDLADAILGGA